MNTIVPPLNHREPTIRLIAECVCLRFNVSFSELISARRQKRLVTPRHIAMHLARKLTRRSYPEIGARLGGRDHTTVMNSDTRIHEQLNNPEIATAISEIETAVLAGQITATKLGTSIYVDADALDAANRILDQDVMRISVDELRVMASMIRALSAPIVDISGTGDRPPVYRQPQYGQIASYHDLACQAVAAWNDFLNCELSSGEKAARQTLTKTMQALALATKEI
jgi:Bacterial dnaA protein helix-turn-helix